MVCFGFDTQVTGPLGSQGMASQALLQTITGVWSDGFQKIKKKQLYKCGPCKNGPRSKSTSGSRAMALSLETKDLLPLFVYILYVSITKHEKKTQ